MCPLLVREGWQGAYTHGSDKGVHRTTANASHLHKQRLALKNKRFRPNLHLLPHIWAKTHSC